MKNYLNPLSTKEAVNEMLKRGVITEHVTKHESKKGIGYWLYVAGVVTIWFYIAYLLVSLI